jgi:hypothetical protein
MPRRCTICDHDQRDAIDAALVMGNTSNLELSSLFGVSESALRRHKKKHLPATMALAQEAADVAHADDLLSQLDGLKRDAYRIRDKAENAGDFRAALTGIRELVRVVELMAKVRGELDESPKVAVVITQSGEWQRLRERLLQALEPYPQARLAVVEAIRGAD